MITILLNKTNHTYFLFTNRLSTDDKFAVSFFLAEAHVLLLGGKPGYCTRDKRDSFGRTIFPLLFDMSLSLIFSAPCYR